MSETTRTHATYVALEIASLQTKVMSPSEVLALAAQIDEFIVSGKAETDIRHGIRVVQ